MSIEARMIFLFIGLFLVCGWVYYRSTKRSHEPSHDQPVRNHRNPNGIKVLRQYFHMTKRPEAMIVDGIVNSITGEKEPPYMFFCGPKETTFDEIDPEIRDILLRASRLEPIDPHNPHHREAGKPGFRYFALEFSTRQNQARGNQVVRITQEDEDTLNFYRALYAEDMKFYLDTINQLGATSTGGNMVTADGQRATNFLQSHALVTAAEARLRGKAIRAKTETALNLKAVTTLEVDKVGSPGSHANNVVNIKRSS